MRKSLFVWALTCSAYLPAFAGEPLASNDYNKKFGVSIGDAGEQKAIAKCLTRWPDHPFKEGAQTKIRRLETSVSVMGIGSDAIVDNAHSLEPQLILIRPSVSVMTKQVYELQNPNGWYCFKANVNVMSKGVIKAHCASHIADSNGSVAVIGTNQQGAGGVTVMGKTVIERPWCSQKAKG